MISWEGDLQDLLMAIADAWPTRDDRTEELVAERRSIAADDRPRELRDQKLRSLMCVEVFPAGVLATPTSGAPTLREVVVAVTTDDLVLMDANVRRDPDGEIGRIVRNEVSAVRLVDENGHPLAMTLPRDVLELDDPPSRRYVVAVDRRDGDRVVSHAFVFRSLSVADEARRDFERNVPTSA
ncbi:MAG TPA: hypothetical protein VFP13_06670 [Actinomycetota bacterium]|nr:hypothetical protein [Actinomycetota bacterium]